jgi:hypothetical protein
VYALGSLAGKVQYRKTSQNSKHYLSYFFHSRTMHPDIKFLFIQLNALLDYSRLKLTLEFTLKCCYMFQLTKHHQGAYCRALLMHGSKLPGDLE